ncbi:MAG: HD domain-containing protein [Ruminococcus sp.]|nr:HD domain-containing protein [Ruminococcus sp.]
MLCGGTVNGFAEDAAVTEDQSLSVDPTSTSDGYTAVLYDNTNGLPTSEANAIAETKEGFIWIGSYSGLIRYDGNTFERFDSTTGIASVVSLFVDSKNRLWVGTNDSGVAVMENGEFRMYGKADGLQSLSVRSIIEDGSGNIYIATTHGMVSMDEDLNMTPIDEPQINDEYIRMLTLGRDDVVYGVTNNNAIFTMKNKKLTGYYNPEKLGISRVRSIHPDEEKPGTVYIATNESELYHGELEKGFNSKSCITTTGLFSINSLNELGGKVWICSDTGIGILDGGSLTKLEGIPMDTSVEHIMLDYQGNLWFVSSQQGVMKIVPNQFVDLFEKRGLEKDVVNSTCIYNDILFIGTKNSGIKGLKNGKIIDSYPITSAAYADGSKADMTDLFEFLSESRIRSIIRDSKNRIWFSTFGDEGLIRLDGRNALIFNEQCGLPSSRVRTVYEKSDGAFLVCCTGGVAVIENDKVTELFGETAGINNTEVLTVTEGAGGEFILGTDGDGIYVVKDHKAVHYGTESGLSSDVVMRIKRDLKRELYWIVTSNSIAYMDKDHKITTIRKFPYSNNFDLYESSSDEMWVLSSNGIYVVPVDELLANGEINPIYYGKDNGLPCIATSNSYSELTASGDLYISCTTGVAKVNIEKPFENISDVKLAVPFVKADGELIYPESDGSFHISSGVRKLTVCSYVYNYSLENPQVTYSLEGFDSNSVTVKRSELAPADYTNLSGGEYVFKIQITDVKGNSSKELNVRIVKDKTVFESVWFMIIVILMILLLIAVLVQKYISRRTQKYLKKQEENETLIREIVEAFAKVIDMKDKYTNGHSTRVAEYTSMLTKELGYDDETVQKYYNIALMHDIGKVGVPPEVLNKPGKLTDDEFKIIKSHSSLGFNTLKSISIMPELAIGAGAHHERPDGKGYPKGLKGDEIPRVAQIIAVADTFDAMYSDRPYRKRMNFDKAVSIIKEVRGTQLTEDVVDAFLRLVEKGEFRAPDDTGGGTTEDIDNIHKKQRKTPAKE